jgi:hypothetical protein
MSRKTPTGSFSSSRHASVYHEMPKDKPSHHIRRSNMSLSNHIDIFRSPPAYFPWDFTSKTRILSFLEMPTGLTTDSEKGYFVRTGSRF